MFYIYTVDAKPDSPGAGFHNLVNAVPTIEKALELVADMKRAHPHRRHLIGFERFDAAEVARAIKLQPHLPE